MMKLEDRSDLSADIARLNLAREEAKRIQAKVLGSYAEWIKIRDEVHARRASKLSEVS